MRTYTALAGFLVVLCAVLSTYSLQAIDMFKDASTKPSYDRTELHNLFELDLPMGTARWEVFGTPEHKGGVPGPSDYITLIAELAPADQKTFAMRPETGIVWIAPEAARPWLSKRFRLLLSAHRNSSINMSSVFSCRGFQAKVKRTGRLADGFICEDSEKSLIYLTLSSFSDAQGAGADH